MKIAGKIVKLYLGGCVIMWAGIGISNLIHYLRCHPGCSVVEADSAVIDDAMEQYKFILGIEE